MNGEQHRDNLSLGLENLTEEIQLLKSGESKIFRI